MKKSTLNEASRQGIQFITWIKNLNTQVDDCTEENVYTVVQAIVEEQAQSTRRSAPQLGSLRFVLHNKNLVMQKSGTLLFRLQIWIATSAPPRILKSLKKTRNNLKEILCKFSKISRNLGKNEKNLIRFYRNTSMITHSLSIQFIDTNAPSECGIPMGFPF